MLCVLLILSTHFSSSWTFYPIKISFENPPSYINKKMSNGAAGYDIFQHLHTWNQMIIPVGPLPSGWQHSPDDGRVVTKDTTLRPSQTARHRSLRLLLVDLSLVSPGFLYLRIVPRLAARGEFVLSVDIIRLVTTGTDT